MKNLIVTVNGVAYNVTVEEGTGALLNGDIISNAVNGNDQVFHRNVLPISRLMITG